MVVQNLRLRKDLMKLETSVKPRAKWFAGYFWASRIWDRNKESRTKQRSSNNLGFRPIDTQPRYKHSGREPSTKWSSREGVDGGLSCCVKLKSYFAISAFYALSTIFQLLPTFILASSIEACAGPNGPYFPPLMRVCCFQWTHQSLIENRLVIQDGYLGVE